MLCAFELGSIKVFYHTKILICINYFLLTSLYVFRIFSFRLRNDTFTYSFDSLLDFNYKFLFIHLIHLAFLNDMGLSKIRRLKQFLFVLSNKQQVLQI